MCLRRLQPRDDQFLLLHVASFADFRARHRTRLLASHKVAGHSARNRAQYHAKQKADGNNYANDKVYSSSILHISSIPIYDLQVQLYNSTERLEGR
jgi:hypothetical protein